jgi:hypothetical protein
MHFKKMSFPPSKFSTEHLTDPVQNLGFPWYKPKLIGGLLNSIVFLPEYIKE